MLSFILVRPQLGENIGAAARIMKNFGFRNLRLVAPRDGWPNPAADAMAAGGKDVLKNATLYPSLEAASADLSLLFATTARRRDMVKPVRTPQQLGAQLRSDYPNTALPPTGILFGPERTGLENQEVALADAIVTLKVNPDYPSLNLAQTVAILAYELSDYTLEARATSTERPPPPLAPKEQISALCKHLEQALDQANFWSVAEKKTPMLNNLVNMFTRAGWSQQEVRTMRGIIRALTEQQPGSDPADTAE